MSTLGRHAGPFQSGGLIVNGQKCICCAFGTKSVFLHVKWHHFTAVATVSLLVNIKYMAAVIKGLQKVQKMLIQNHSSIRPNL